MLNIKTSILKCREGVNIEKGYSYLRLSLLSIKQEIFWYYKLSLI